MTFGEWLVILNGILILVENNCKWKLVPKFKVCEIR